METEKIVSKKSWFRKHPVLTGFGGLVILIIILSSIGGESKKENNQVANNQPEQKVEAIKLEAETLRQAYKANEVNGDNLYKGKLVEISGTVDTIGKDLSDEAYVTFETNEQYAFDKVQCMFKTAEEAGLAQLKKGQSFKAQGTVSGVVISGVIVRNCKVL